METRKICKLLIVIFAVLGVLFYVLYSNELENRAVLEEAFVEDAVTNLKSNGIEMSKGIIERNIPDIDIYTIKFSDVQKHNSVISDVLVKEIYDYDKIIMTNFDVPSGRSVGIYDMNDTSKELGRVVFKNTDMSFVYSKKGVNISGMDEPLINGVNSGFSDKNKKTIEKILGDLCKEAGLGYEICGSSVDEKIEMITVIQTMDNYDINGSFVNFVFNDEEIVKVNGKLITEFPNRQYHEELVDGVNVLYKLDLNNVSEISSEELVYSLKKTEDNTHYLLPGWKITYTDKLGAIKTVFFDAL